MNQKEYVGDMGYVGSDESYQPDPHIPFFYASRSTIPDLSYVATGLIRYRGEFTLIDHQVAHFSTPSTGFINYDVEFLLHLLLARVHVEDGRFKHFDVAQDGMPDRNNSTLCSESCVYSFRADSTGGFLGLDAKELNPVDRRDIEDMVRGDGMNSVTDFLRRADGHLEYTPRFYREVEPGEDSEFLPHMFDVAHKRWLRLVEIPGIFLPFIRKDQDFEAKRRELEARLAMSDNCRWNRKVYVGVSTVTFNGKGVLPAPEQLNKIEKLHYTGGYNRFHDAGLGIDWYRLPRPVREFDRHKSLTGILNANGIYNWQKLMTN